LCASPLRHFQKRKMGQWLVASVAGVSAGRGHAEVEYAYMLGFKKFASTPQNFSSGERKTIQEEIRPLSMNGWIERGRGILSKSDKGKIVYHSCAHVASMMHLFLENCVPGSARIEDLVKLLENTHNRPVLWVIVVLGQC
jgi:hypothetical protein